MTVRTRGYLCLGLYYYHLRRWLTVVPRQSLAVIDAADFRQRPSEVLQRLLTFSGVGIAHGDFNASAVSNLYSPDDPFPFGPDLEAEVRQWQREYQRVREATRFNVSAEDEAFVDGQGLRHWENVKLAKQLAAKVFEQPQRLLRSLNLTLL